MSYDLAVFDPAVTPRTREEFDLWYDQISEWEDEEEYEDISKCSPGLQAWYREMLAVFGAMNGPDALEHDFNKQPEPVLADYCIARELIYVAFSWGEAERAFETVTRLAAKHGVGFLDASGATGAAWFPDGKGELELVHEHSGAEDE
jgi:hypothetical protein